LEFTSKPPRELLRELEGRGYGTIAIVGGASVNSAFLNEGLIDEMYLTVEPKIFGEGMSVFKTAPENVILKFLETQKLSDDVVMLHYEVKK
ncbi:MAG: dihydrofolate reductase family protein, partial [Patescibacteria group bacterium]